MGLNCIINQFFRKKIFREAQTFYTYKGSLPYPPCSNDITWIIFDNASSINLSDYNALKLMEQRKSQISLLPVVDSDNKFLGFIRLHDLLKEGFLFGS